MMDFLTLLKEAKDESLIDEKVYTNFLQLYESFLQSLGRHQSQLYEEHFIRYLECVKYLIKNPFVFDHYHKKVTQPTDYYRLGINFIRPLVDESKSQVFKLQNVAKMQQQLAKQENVVLFANHQTEADPQLISIALEKDYPDLVSEMIFVAGDRVVTDPLAIPLSMGRNLLCIYSKRHIDNPPEKKHEKQLHNRRTMHAMKRLFSEGGKCIYVAPSGGRDRPNQFGEVEVASFDPQSIEMFRLMAKEGGRPTHFYPLALKTYDILPPPNKVETELGETRKAKKEGILFSFGDEIDMTSYPGHDSEDRHLKRDLLANYLWQLVNNDYLILKKQDSSSNS